MIIARINPDRFLDLVCKAPLIAFQKLEFGYAVAGSCEAYYAPISHPGGGNLVYESPVLGDGFLNALGHVFIVRMSMPALRTLRPTAKPIPSAALVNHLRVAFGPSPEAMSNYDKAAGDHPAVVDSECQVVIQAIKEHEEPGLKDAMQVGKRDMMSEALDLVIEHAEAARELCEVGEDKPALIKMNLLQTSAALQTALEMLLQP